MHLTKQRLGKVSLQQKERKGGGRRDLHVSKEEMGTRASACDRHRDLEAVEVILHQLTDPRARESAFQNLGNIWEYEVAKFHVSLKLPGKYVEIRASQISCFLEKYLRNIWEYG